MSSLMKKAKFLILGLICFIVLHLYFGFGNLLNYSFLDRQLMIENQFTNGYVSERMRWLHFFAWTPTNVAGLFASSIGLYLAYQAHRGNFFTIGFGLGLWYLGVAVIIAGLTDMMARSIVPHILSAENPAGQVPISLFFSAEIFGLVFCGFGFLAMGNTMLEATRLSEENKGFV